MKIFRDKIELDYRPKLYLSDALMGRDLTRIKRNIARGKGSCSVILISDNDNDQFDIVTPFQLKLPVWEGKKPVVAGIADGKEDAEALVMKIISDCLKSRGDLKLKEYICSL
ncbi:MAG: hypothetical protein K5871_04145 [Lachnospiraceae bacterium]|nr:hypothetical protein [Lachnospiraceae bacterium]